MSNDRRPPIGTSSTRSTTRNKRAKPESEADTDTEFATPDLIDEIVSLKNIVLSCENNIKTLIADNVFLKKEIVDLRKNLNVRDSLNDIKNIIVKDKNKSSSYAEKVKNIEPEICIIPNKDQDAATTKSDLNVHICPSKISVDSVRKTANGALIFKCNNKESSDKLKSEVAEKLNANYSVKITATKNPCFRIVNISEKTSDDQIVKKLKMQNDCIPDDAELKVIKTMERTIDEKTTYSAIIETSAKVYDDVVQRGKLSIGWDMCKVFEYIYIARCYKCMGFNHMAKVCTKKQACLKCSGEHQIKDCTSENTKCINCSLAATKLNLPMDTNHQANSMKCTIFQRQVERERKRIDYIN